MSVPDQISGDRLRGFTQFLVKHHGCAAGFDVSHPDGAGNGRLAIACRGCGGSFDYVTARIEDDGFAAALGQSAGAPLAGLEPAPGEPTTAAPDAVTGPPDQPAHEATPRVPPEQPYPPGRAPGGGDLGMATAGPPPPPPAAGPVPAPPKPAGGPGPATPTRPAAPPKPAASAPAKPTGGPGPAAPAAETVAAAAPEASGAQPVPPEPPAPFLGPAEDWRRRPSSPRLTLMLAVLAIVATTVAVIRIAGSGGGGSSETSRGTPGAATPGPPAPGSAPTPAAGRDVTLKTQAYSVTLPGSWDKRTRGGALSLVPATKAVEVRIFFQRRPDLSVDEMVSEASAFLSEEHPGATVEPDGSRSTAGGSGPQLVAYYQGGSERALVISSGAVRYLILRRVNDGAPATLQRQALAVQRSFSPR